MAAARWPHGGPEPRLLYTAERGCQRTWCGSPGLYPAQAATLQCPLACQDGSGGGRHEGMQHCHSQGCQVGCASGFGTCTYAKSVFAGPDMPPYLAYEIARFRCFCRPLLKQMMKSGDGVSGLNPTEAAELLHFCFQGICSLMKELQLMPPLPDPPGQQPSATQQERNAAG